MTNGKLKPALKRALEKAFRCIRSFVCRPLGFNVKEGLTRRRNSCEILTQDEALKKALGRFFRYNNITCTIVDACYPGDPRDAQWGKEGDLYRGIDVLYDLVWQNKLGDQKKRCVHLLAHDKDGKILAQWAAQRGEEVQKLFESLKEQDIILCHTEPNHWLNRLKTHCKNNTSSAPMGTTSLDPLAALKTLAEAVPVPQGPHGRRLPGAESRFIPDLPWRVVVVDNELLPDPHPPAEEPERCFGVSRVLSWPAWQDVIPIGIYPKSLLDFDDYEHLIRDLAGRVYQENADVVLIDVLLGSGQAGQGKDHKGFYIVPDLRQRLVDLGRLELPIIMFSKYKETGYVVHSLTRGATWYSSKDRREPSWVGNLVKGPGEDGGILAQIFDPGVWKDEYQHRFLGRCSGPLVKAVEEALERGRKGSTSGRDEDFYDEFFVVDGENTFRRVIDACRERGNEWNLQKLGEYHYIFRKLFLPFDRIKVLKKADIGLSGTDVFFVVPYRHSNGTLQEYSPHIVKIGTYEEMLQEKHNFDRWINGMLDSFIGRIKAGPVRAFDYAGLLYVAVGVKEDYTDGRYPVPLKSLVEHYVEERPLWGNRIPPRLMKGFLREVFTKVLASLYRASRKVETYRLIAAYIEDLPSTLSGTLEAIWVREDRYWHGDSSADNRCNDCQNLAKNSSACQTLDQVFSLSREFVLLQDFELFEVDRVRRSLKLLNKSQHLSGLELSETLKRAREMVDLRVDVEIPPGKFDLLFQDPRITRGKRLTVVIRNPKPIWEGQRLRFLKTIPVDSKGVGELAKACREVLEKDSSDWLPYPQLLDKYRELLENRLLVVPRRLTFSPIHGDLNLENILVTFSELGQVLGWFIDFRRSREGPVVFDFVKLETELKTHMLARYLGRLIRKMQIQGTPLRDGIQRGFQWFMDFEKSGQVWQGLLQELRKELFGKEVRQVVRVADLILLVRGLALEEIRLDVVEYLWGLFIYSLRALTFSNLDDPLKSPDPPLPKCLAYLTGCCAYQKLSSIDPVFRNKDAWRSILEKVKAGVPRKSA